MSRADLQTLGATGPDNIAGIIGDKAAEGSEMKSGGIPEEHAAGVPEPDFPPESFWISKDAEYDWVDRNAVYERKESTRGNSNSSNANPSMNSSNSQRSSVKSKASIIGLPRTQKTAFADSKWRTCKAANTRLFPKREKSTVPEAEPGSPKVSCMGRVRSKRGRRRTSSSGTEKPAEKSGNGGEKHKSCFCVNLMSLFRFKKEHGKPPRSGSGKVVEGPEEVEDPPRRSVVLKAREIPVVCDPTADPPSLGGMVRFSSGRRSGNWAAEEINQAL